MIWLGQTEATDDLAGRELRQIALALRFAAIGEDRVHDERRLHRHGRAVAGIDPFHLAFLDRANESELLVVCFS